MFIYGPVYIVHYLLVNQSIIRSTMTQNKIALKRTNEIIKIRMQPIHQNFCNQLVDNTIQTNWTEVFKIGWPLLFRNENHESFCDIPIKILILSSFMNKLPHIITHHFSIGFKENRFEIILTQSMVACFSPLTKLLLLGQLNQVLL